MNDSEPVRISIEAANTLIQWQSLFAAEVCERAKRLAAQYSQPHSVTLSHYRQAAEFALQSLSDTIHNEDGPDGQREAA